ncbi:MAG: ribosome maturation factor RimM [Gammaproteobacteria bacterium]
MSQNKLVIIARLGRPVGVQGFLRVNSFTHPPENILKLFPWQVQRKGAWQELEVESYKQHGDQILVRLKGCLDRDQAALWTNSLIAVPRSALPPIKDDKTYYWSDLVGLEVINQENQNLGKVAEVFATGANDVLRVESREEGQRIERLIPFIKSVILSVSLKEGVIRVDWGKDF